MNALSTYVRDVFDMFFSVCGSMVMGLRTLSRPNVTTEYPRKDKWDVPDGSRMKLYNNIDDCIGCYKCSRICPTDCIEIETIKAPDSVDLGKASTGNPLNFWVPTFDIDMVKCCYCDLCTTVCPTECLVMTKAFEGSAYDRGNLIYHFGNVDSEEMNEINQLLDEGEGGDSATATAGSADTGTTSEGAESAVDSIMGRLLPESLEGLPVKERVRARLITRGKLDDDLPEGVEIDESAAPSGTASKQTETSTRTEDKTDSEEDTESKPSEGESPKGEEQASTSDEPSDENTESSDEAPEEGSGYQRDPDQDLRDRIKNRLKARGKL